MTCSAPTCVTRFAGLTIAAMLAFAPVVPASAQQPTRLDTSDSTVCIAEEGFSVFLPGRPRRASKVVATRFGDEEEITYKLEASGRDYTIGVRYLTVATLTARPESEYLDAIAAGIQRDLHGTTVSFSHITVDGCEGRWYVVEADGYTYFFESCIAGRTEYFVAYIQPGHGPLDEAGRAFFDSFKVQ